VRGHAAKGIREHWHNLQGSGFYKTDSRSDGHKALRGRRRRRRPRGGPTAPARPLVHRAGPSPKQLRGTVALRTAGLRTVGQGKRQQNNGSSQLFSGRRLLGTRSGAAHRHFRNGEGHAAADEGSHCRSLPTVVTPWSMRWMLDAIVISLTGVDSSPPWNSKPSAPTRSRR